MTKSRKRSRPTCPYPGCSCRMGALSFYCRTHWGMVPKHLRDTMRTVQRRDGRHKAVLMRPEAERYIRNKIASLVRRSRKPVKAVRGEFWWQRGDLA